MKDLFAFATPRLGSYAYVMFMSIRYTITVILALAVIGIAVVAMWPTPPLVPGVSRENFARIRNGMTHEEVQAIFGKPCDGILGGAHGPATAGWTADEPLVDVTVAIYVEDGRVCGKRWNGEPESTLERISRWIRSSF